MDVYTISLISGDPMGPTFSECPTCHFDSLQTLRFFHLSDDGVREIGLAPLCVRCADEES